MYLRWLLLLLCAFFIARASCNKENSKSKENHKTSSGGKNSQTTTGEYRTPPPFVKPTGTGETIAPGTGSTPGGPKGKHHHKHSGPHEHGKKLNASEAPKDKQEHKRGGGIILHRRDQDGQGNQEGKSTPAPEGQHSNVTRHYGQGPHDRVPPHEAEGHRKHNGSHKHKGNKHAGHKKGSDDQAISGARYTTGGEYHTPPKIAKHRKSQEEQIAAAKSATGAPKSKEKSKREAVILSKRDEGSHTSHEGKPAAESDSQHPKGSGHHKGHHKNHTGPTPPAGAGESRGPTTVPTILPAQPPSTTVGLGEPTPHVILSKLSTRSPEQQEHISSCLEPYVNLTMVEFACKGDENITKFEKCINESKPITKLEMQLVVRAKTVVCKDTFAGKLTTIGSALDTAGTTDFFRALEKMVGEVGVTKSKHFGSVTPPPPKIATTSSGGQDEKAPKEEPKERKEQQQGSDQQTTAHQGGESQGAFTTPAP